MSNIFLCSDHHFGHSNILTFTDNEGKKVRNFNSISHMQEHMVAQHNSVVRPEDKVYFLGDVTISKSAKHFEVLSRMNGTKILIKGNHDQAKASIYQQYFKDIRAVHQLDIFVLTHVPMHPASLARWGYNAHGHLHTNRVMLDGLPDPRYVCVCMEQLDNYTPISLEQLKLKVKNLT